MSSCQEELRRETGVGNSAAGLNGVEHPASLDGSLRVLSHPGWGEQSYVASWRGYTCQPGEHLRRELSAEWRNPPARLRSVSGESEHAVCMQTGPWKAMGSSSSPTLFSWARHLLEVK